MGPGKSVSGSWIDLVLRCSLPREPGEAYSDFNGSDCSDEDDSDSDDEE